MIQSHALKTLPVLLIALVCGCGGSSTETREPAGDETAAFCSEHQVAEAICAWCNPGLIESLGFCRGHGVPEAFCYRCNPALIPAFKAVGDWCAGHDRPESQCYICNPGLDPALEESTQEGGGDLRSLKEDHTAILGPQGDRPARVQQPPSISCSKQDLVVRFETPAVARDTGIELAVVETRPITETVECGAVIAYDGNRFAHLSSLVPGVVEEVHKDLGEAVAPGEALATIASAHLGAAKAVLLRAQAAVDLWGRNHARESELLAGGVSTERDLLEAQTRLEESRISLSAAEHALLGLGLSESGIDDVLCTGDTSARYTVRASFPAVVVERHAVIGERADPADPLFAVADVSRMWAMLDVYETDARHLQPGQNAVIHVEGLPGEAFGGRIDWVDPRVDPRTRTLRAKVELDNASGLLRADMFARAEVLLRDSHPALVVPVSAVQWEGCCNVVFVRRSETVYEPRKVRLGLATGTLYEVLGGVGAGEQVVTQGSFLLKTEILKGSIGAGCCEVDPGA